MKKKTLCGLVLLATACSQQKTEQTEQLVIPPGMSIHSQFTTRMTYENLPADDVTYLSPQTSEVTMYSTFDGITIEPHNYWIVIASEAGIQCQDPPYAFTPGGSSENVWTRISVSNCMAVPGDYVVKVYLDGNWVLAKDLRVLSEADISSGKFDAYWDKDRYLESLPAPKTRQKGDWLVRRQATLDGNALELYTIAHKGHTRFFVLTVEDAVYRIKESTNYGLQEIFTFERGEQDQPALIQFAVVGDELYFYNDRVKQSLNLNSGKVQAATLPFEPGPENSFQSPSGKYFVTRDGKLNGQPLTASAECTGGVLVENVSWSDDEQRVFYQLRCRNRETLSGFYEQPTAGGKARRLMADLEQVVCTSYFSNGGADFFAVLQDQEGQPPVIKLVTQFQYYSEFGFGADYDWTRSITLSVEHRDPEGGYLQAEFLSTPKEYLSYSYSDEYGMASKDGSIAHIGALTGGTLAGKQIYRLLDQEFYEDKGGGGKAYSTVEPLYLVRDGDAIVMFNLQYGEKAVNQYSFPDLDGKRLRSELFAGATRVISYRGQLIAGLISAPTLEIPNSSVKLVRQGMMYGGTYESKTDFRKLFDHPDEGEMYVFQKDDGSFWRFNGDRTTTLYAYAFDFGVTIDGSPVDMNQYAPYTNLICDGSPLDLAHILTPDPSRLMQTGATSANEPVFGFTSSQDQLLKDEYDLLKKDYDDLGQQFQSYDVFVSNRPIFLWKDPFGRHVRFVKKEYLSPSNCEPVLYLYPEEASEVSIALGDKVKLLSALPDREEGWRVRAEPDGRLTDLSTFRTYDRIFWEGISGALPALEKGFVVKAAQLEPFLDEKLALLGLKPKEILDFKRAWLREFDGAPWYFIGFYDRAIIDRYAPMTITPEPETVIRILMDYRALDEFVEVEPPALGPTPARTGFTAVEWAGLKRF